MKRCFITFADGELYESLASILKKSINMHSQYDLLIYNRTHFNQSFDFKSSIGFAYKILSCLKAIEDYDEVVWIDCDSVVTKYIDKIWFESYRLKNYPLIPYNRFDNFDENVIYQKNYTYINEEALSFFNIENKNYIYKQCCLMYFDKRCIDFYKTILSFFNSDFDSLIFPFGDETIINCLLIKNNYTDNLGNCFLCSHYFHNVIPNFLTLKNKEDFRDVFEKFNITYNNFNEILFLHGSKDDILHKYFLQLMNNQNIYSNLIKNFNSKKDLFINYDLSFNSGPFLSVGANQLDEWNVEFINGDKIIYSTVLGNNMWSRVNKKYYVDWKVIIKNKNSVYLDYKLNLSNKNVLIDFKSASLGDSIAWIPYVEEFRLKHNCKIFCNTIFSEIFEDQYPNISFTKNIKMEIPFFATYELGYFIKDEDRIEGDVRNMSLQEIACKILGLENKEIKPKLIKHHKTTDEKSVCIAIQSTAQCKYWNNQNGWIKTIEYLKNLGYKVYCIDKNYSYGSKDKMNIVPYNAIDKTGDFTLTERIKQIKEADFFIGLGSGLSWLAWACEKPVIMISGFSDPKSEFYTPYRVHNKNVCNSCWNDSSVEFDKGDWLWCPRNKNFECSKEITFEMVKEKIDQCINDLKI